MNIFVCTELTAEKIYKMNSEKWNPETSAHFKFDGYGKKNSLKVVVIYI